MSLFSRLFSRNKGKSKEVAKDRLLAVLAYDRTNLSNVEMDQIKEEIIEVISRYITIDKAGANIALAKRRRQSRLIAQIPIISAIHN